MNRSGVLLIGWFNHTNSQLKNYYKLYRKLGFNQINNIQYKSCDVLSLSRANDFCENYNLNNPIKRHYDIIHCFSGGSIVAFYLANLGVAYDKIIFDSGPMYLSDECFANYACNSLDLNGESNFKLFEYFINKAWAIEKMRSGRLRDFHTNILENYESEKFLFSKQKKLILNDPSDKLILNHRFDKLKKMDNIQFKYFYNSKHIQHFRYFPNYYHKLIHNFLNY